tara:strand:- start:312 stop:536 length:225 start_codon:yes stop_codon:yes gene_type:complete
MSQFGGLIERSFSMLFSLLAALRSVVALDDFEDVFEELIGLVSVVGSSNPVSCASFGHVSEFVDYSVPDASGHV